MKINTPLQVIEQEIKGLESLKPVFDSKFDRFVDLVFGLEGRLILSGMGKSGYIAQKIASTLSSTGTPSFFIHPSEASHGDLGMITKKDAILLLSNSGETPELKDIIYFVKRLGIPLIAIVRNAESEVIKIADIAFVLPNIAEANLIKAPTTSTTQMLAFGDALAVTLLEKRGFNKQDFSKLHPGGKIGKEFIKVEGLMRKGNLIPTVLQNSSMKKAILEISKKGLGIVGVLDDKERLIGVISDGDLRRNLVANLLEKKVEEVMSLNPFTITKDQLALEALNIMQGEKKITCLFVVDENKKIEGVIHLHDLLSGGIR